LTLSLSLLFSPLLFSVVLSATLFLHHCLTASFGTLLSLHCCFSWSIHLFSLSFFPLLFLHLITLSLFFFCVTDICS
jgi:hypothetical protein